jgi:hypothetical protein
MKNWTEYEKCHRCGDDVPAGKQCCYNICVVCGNDETYPCRCDRNAWPSRTGRAQPATHGIPCAARQWHGGASQVVKRKGHVNRATGGLPAQKGGNRYSG